MKLKSYNLIIGASEYGKSWFAKKQLLKLKTPVLYINWIGDKSDWNGYIKVNSKTPRSVMVDKLRQNKKLVYFTDDKTENKVKEVLALYKMVKGDKRLTLVLDEVHLMSMQKGLIKWLIELATSGRHHLKHIVYVTQRMSRIPNEIFTQSQMFYFFTQKMENQYYKREGFDYEKRVASKLKGRKYYYCEYDGFNVSEAKAS